MRSADVLVVQVGALRCPGGAGHLVRGQRAVRRPERHACFAAEVGHGGRHVDAVRGPGDGVDVGAVRRRADVAIGVASVLPSNITAVEKQAVRRHRPRAGPARRPVHTRTYLCVPASSNLLPAMRDSTSRCGWSVVKAPGVMEALAIGLPGWCDGRGRLHGRLAGVAGPAEGGSRREKTCPPTGWYRSACLRLRVGVAAGS